MLKTLLVGQLAEEMYFALSQTLTLSRSVTGYNMINMSGKKKTLQYMTIGSVTKIFKYMGQNYFGKKKRSNTKVGI